MAAKKRRKLMLACEICTQPVYLSPRRYVELVRAGRLPRCRKNGCERLCGAKNFGTARTPQVLCTVPVGMQRVEWSSTKRGNVNGALAKMRVKRDDDWRYEPTVAVDR